MKVLIQGKYWWAGLRAQCQKCATTVEFDGTADELMLLRNSAGVPILYSWECPTCGEPNEVTVEWLQAWQPMLARLIAAA